jgi:hypothetical protein
MVSKAIWQAAASIYGVYQLDWDGEAWPIVLVMELMRVARRKVLVAVGNSCLEDPSLTLRAMRWSVGKEPSLTLRAKRDCKLGFVARSVSEGHGPGTSGY